MAEESGKEQLQQSGNNRTAHALYASGSIYAATKVGVATKIQILVWPKPDQPDRLLRPCLSCIVQTLSQCQVRIEATVPIFIIIDVLKWKQTSNLLVNEKRRCRDG